MAPSESLHVIVVCDPPVVASDLAVAVMSVSGASVNVVTNDVPGHVLPAFSTTVWDVVSMAKPAGAAVSVHVYVPCTRLPTHAVPSAAVVTLATTLLAASFRSNLAPASAAAPLSDTFLTA